MYPMLTIEVLNGSSFEMRGIERYSQGFEKTLHR